MCCAMEREAVRETRPPFSLNITAYLSTPLLPPTIKPPVSQSMLLSPFPHTLLNALLMDVRAETVVNLISFS